MRRKIKYLMPVMLACSMMQFSCSDWTDPESINIHTPSMEEQNPELYAQYLESLNNFKATDHQVVIVSVNNVSTVTTSRSQHLTDMPDSLDYICLNNTMEVNQANISEMKEVRRLGTKVLGLVDFDAIESAWKKILEEEAANAVPNPESDETENGEEGEETVDDATRFIEYCKSEVTKQIAASNALDVDGIVVNYTGFDLNSLVEENEIGKLRILIRTCFSKVTRRTLLVKVCFLIVNTSLSMRMEQKTNTRCLISYSWHQQKTYQPTASSWE